jgi:hypothetical protein
MVAQLNRAHAIVYLDYDEGVGASAGGNTSPVAESERAAHNASLDRAHVYVLTTLMMLSFHENRHADVISRYQE